MVLRFSKFVYCFRRFMQFLVGANRLNFSWLCAHLSSARLYSLFHSRNVVQKRTNWCQNIEINGGRLLTSNYVHQIIFIFVANLISLFKEFIIIYLRQGFQIINYFSLSSPCVRIFTQLFTQICWICRVRMRAARSRYLLFRALEFASRDWCAVGARRRLQWI